MKRAMILLVFGLGVFAGLKIERLMQQDRCLDAGGRVSAGGYCEGIVPQ